MVVSIKDDAEGDNRHCLARLKIIILIIDSFF